MAAMQRVTDAVLCVARVRARGRIRRHSFAWLYCARLVWDVHSGHLSSPFAAHTNEKKKRRMDDAHNEQRAPINADRQILLVGARGAHSTQCCARSDDDGWLRSVRVAHLPAEVQS